MRTISTGVTSPLDNMTYSQRLRLGEPDSQYILIQDHIHHLPALPAATARDNELLPEDIYLQDGLLPEDIWRSEGNLLVLRGGMLNVEDEKGRKRTEIGHEGKFAEEKLMDNVIKKNEV